MGKYLPKVLYYRNWVVSFRDYHLTVRDRPLVLQSYPHLNYRRKEDTDTRTDSKSV